MKHFKYSIDNKRYHTLHYYNQSKYNKRVYKAALNANFTCPNIDGTCGVGGCIFCLGGSGYFTNPNLSVSAQLDAEILRIRKKFPDCLIIAYLQANTNTYGTDSELDILYHEILSNKEVSGLSIATRADCLSDEILNLLEIYNTRTELTVELGLQTVHDKTAKYINRGHTYSEFLEGYQKLKRRGIRVCVHIINGLFGESIEMMEHTAKEVGMLHPDAVKIQMLHIIEGTRLADIYQKTPFELLDRDAYIALVAKQITFLPPETVIERITGDPDKNNLIAPSWTRDKRFILGGVDKYLLLNDWVQGERYP